MLVRLHELAERGENFAFETTLGQSIVRPLRVQWHARCGGIAGERTQSFSLHFDKKSSTLLSKL